jgi:hypothetical protein
MSPTPSAHPTIIQWSPMCDLSLPITELASGGVTFTVRTGNVLIPNFYRRHELSSQA